MKVTLAKSAGFCFGVKRAVQMAEEAGAQFDNVVMLGSVIHNKDVVGRLEELGVGLIQSVEEVQEGQRVVIRSHGESRAVYEKLLEKKAIIVDATCPKVKEIHEIVQRGEVEKQQVIIMGDSNHPEVQATFGWCEGAVVVESFQELDEMFLSGKLCKDVSFLMVSQTTASLKKWEEIKKNTKKLCTNGVFFDTICRATYKRQEEASALAKVSECMVVIGDRKSANSNHLVEVCKDSCLQVLFIERACDLNLSLLTGACNVGITAGASTPEWIIKEVCNKMSEKEMEIEESFAEMLDKSFKTLNMGEKVTGIVTNITPNEIHVDLGTKHAGFIPVSELTDDPNVKVEDIVKVGDEIETEVTRINDQEGVVTLSKRRLDANKHWVEIEKAYEDETVVEGIVTEENRGGVVVFVKGVRVFVPASQTGLPREASMSEIMKQKVSLVITEVTRARRRVVGSISRVTRAARAKEAEKVWADIEEGKRYTGEVKSLTSYGAFVDIGGVDGMVHISELSWKRVKHPSEVVSVGDKVDVFVIAADTEKKKISLGMKDHSQDPWTAFTDKYTVGDTAEVRIVKLMAFGAFAEVVSGVDGLIHISQMATHRVDKPADVVSEGQLVDVQITDIDSDNKKVSLSMRALMSEEDNYDDED